MTEIDLAAVTQACITAPAGCGKTQLIADTLRRHEDSKPILVLTHTNAGVAALRKRLGEAKVRSSAYRLSTIDGWSIKLASTFPARSGVSPETLQLNAPGTQYPQIRDAAVALVEGGHVDDVLAASYSRLVVDEYQDCSKRQHALISAASSSLPTVILGDPLQAIFGFGGDPLARWNEDVLSVFPVKGELSTPWRWINAGAEELGAWLLEARGKLLKGEGIDLRAAPKRVKWVELDGTEDRARMLAAGRIDPPDGIGSVLIIGDSTSPNSQRLFARQTPGAVTIEAVDLRDLVQFAASLDLKSSRALQAVVEFAESVMTNVGAEDLLKRVKSLTEGTARKGASEVEAAALSFIREPTYQGVRDLLVLIGKEGAVRAHRPAVLRGCLQALNNCSIPDSPSFHEAAIRVREQNRVVGRALPRRAVGSTLLLKGLEAEVAVLLQADSWSSQNLYVALTRGAKLVTVCSEESLLHPSIA